MTPVHPPFGIENRRQRELQACALPPPALGNRSSNGGDISAAERTDESRQDPHSLARPRQPQDVFGDELRSVEPRNPAERAADDPDAPITAYYQDRDVGVL